MGAGRASGATLEMVLYEEFNCSVMGPDHL